MDVDAPSLKKQKQLLLQNHQQHPQIMNGESPRKRLRCGNNNNNSGSVVSNNNDAPPASKAKTSPANSSNSSGELLNSNSTTAEHAPQRSSSTSTAAVSAQNNNSANNNPTQSAFAVASSSSSSPGTNNLSSTGLLLPQSASSNIITTSTNITTSTPTLSTNSNNQNNNQNSVAVSSLNSNPAQHPVANSSSTAPSLVDDKQHIVSGNTEMNVQLQAHLQQLMLQNQLLTLIQQQQQSQQQQQQMLQQRVSHFLSTPLNPEPTGDSKHQLFQQSQPTTPHFSSSADRFLSATSADTSQQSGGPLAAILPLLTGQHAQQQQQPQLNLSSLTDILLRCGVPGTSGNKLSINNNTSNSQLASANQIASQLFQSSLDHQSSSSNTPFTYQSSSATSGLYAHGVCRWPGCETICEGPDAFTRHLAEMHPPDEKAAAQTCVQAQIVTQLEEQLTRERRRFDAMMNYLQLAKTPSGNVASGYNSNNSSTNTNNNTSNTSVFSNLSTQPPQLSAFLPGSSSQLSVTNPSSVTAIAAAANLLTAAASA